MGELFNESVLFNLWHREPVATAIVLSIHVGTRRTSEVESHD